MAQGQHATHGLFLGSLSARQLRLVPFCFSSALACKIVAHACMELLQVSVMATYCRIGRFKKKIQHLSSSDFSDFFANAVSYDFALLEIRLLSFVALDIEN
jgi:hypothetical protein